MRRIAIVGLFLAFCAMPVRADDASRLALARQVVETAHVADNMRALMPTMIDQMRQLLVAQGSSDSKQIDSFLKGFGQRFDQQVDTFVDLAAGVYAREFSDDDLTSLLAFYKTSTGQHLLGKQTVIAQAMMLAGQQWGQTMAKQVLDDFNKQKNTAPPKL